MLLILLKQIHEMEKYNPNFVNNFFSECLFYCIKLSRVCRQKVSSSIIFLLFPVGTYGMCHILEKKPNLQTKSSQIISGDYKNCWWILIFLLILIFWIRFQSETFLFILQESLKIILMFKKKGIV